VAISGSIAISGNIIPRTAQASLKSGAEPKGFQQTIKDDTTNAIKISLQDCLACSGCVTTAETMLLQHQSAGELLEKLKEPGVTVVASVSSQSCASLAAAYGMTMAEVWTINV
jgi:iron only hydrogenase large subunit-like protein